jgi:NAD(P)-dependent dehydrogenase (short-subunit alcohol dehydrogenase family)
MGDRVEGKMALVTGAAQGLGRAIAEKLAEHGAAVMCTDINGDGASETAALINARKGGRAFAMQHDVTSEPRWIEVVADSVRLMGGINILVNNAGIGSLGHVEKETLDNFRRVHAVDVDSVFLGAKHCMPHLREHAPGSIINISSIAGLIASQHYAAYNSAKAAVWNLSKSIALHAAKTAPGVRSNSVHPTFIKTPILEGIAATAGSIEEAHAKLARQVPIGRLGEPEEVAFLVLFLASDESRFITGAEFKIDGGISAM